jgi:ectoine hydroxylase-related dioxygenase (phytanoyl-CoA dioxygenase family)
MNKNIIKIIKEEIENFEKEDSLEMPEKTDPTKGVVAPSQKVISDVCEKEKFCKKCNFCSLDKVRSWSCGSVICKETF